MALHVGTAAACLALLAPWCCSARSGIPGDAVIDKNIPYVTNAHPRQTLDLFRPADHGGRKLPLIVWIHGGAWRVGEKDWINVPYLVGRGFALASIDYRLSGDAPFPAQIRDCNAALNFLLDHAEAYGFDTNRVVIAGASAGGHLALLTGLARIEEFGARAFKPCAVIDFFGITDLAALSESITDPGTRADMDESTELLLGGPLSEIPEKGRKASPTTYIRGDNPPVLLLHGDKDWLVPIDQSRLMLDALRKAGVKSELIAIDGVGHDGPEFESPDTRRKVLAFLEDVLSAP
jgi:acetyl esterase/lipase